MNESQNQKENVRKFVNITLSLDRETYLKAEELKKRGISLSFIFRNLVNKIHKENLDYFKIIV